MIYAHIRKLALDLSLIGEATYNCPKEITFYMYSFFIYFSQINNLGATILLCLCISVCVSDATRMPNKKYFALPLYLWIDICICNFAVYNERKLREIVEIYCLCWTHRIIIFYFYFSQCVVVSYIQEESKQIHWKLTYHVKKTLGTLEIFNTL